MLSIYTYGSNLTNFQCFTRNGEKMCEVLTNLHYWGWVAVFIAMLSVPTVILAGLDMQHKLH